MKIIFLIPPSEGKNSESLYKKEELSFSFEKPLIIAENATEKDLKCTGKRFEEAINLNKNITSPQPYPRALSLASQFTLSPFKGEGVYTLEAIKRYSGVMYNSIDYFGMSDIGKKYFSENFLILSGMYGLVKPQDKIGNYKLPIETKGLSKFWQEKITSSLNTLEADYIVDLLPNSYKKMIDFKKINSKIIEVNFLKPDGKKISHGVKKIKGEWIKGICEKKEINYKNFGKIYFENSKKIEINIEV